MVDELKTHRKYCPRCYQSVVRNGPRWFCSSCRSFVDPFRWQDARFFDAPEFLFPPAMSAAALRLINGFSTQQVDVTPEQLVGFDEELHASRFVEADLANDRVLLALDGLYRLEWFCTLTADTKTLWRFELYEHPVGGSASPLGLTYELEYAATVPRTVLLQGLYVHPGGGTKIAIEVWVTSNSGLKIVRPLDMQLSAVYLGPIVRGAS